MAFRTPSLFGARSPRELQVATRVAASTLLRIRCGLPLGGCVVAGLLGCARSAPVELEPLVPAAPPSFATRLAGIDVAHVEIYGGTHGSYSADDLRVARIEGSKDAHQVEDDGGLRKRTASGYVLGGHPVRLSFDYGSLYFDAEGAPEGERVTVDVAWIDPPAMKPLEAAEALLSALDPGDSATVWFDAGLGQLGNVSATGLERLGLAPMLLHSQRVAELSDAAEAEALAAIPAGAPFADGGEEPTPTLALEAFLAFCESELLVRRGADALPSLAAPADAWFGGTLPLKPGPAGAALRSLAGVMHRLFLESVAGTSPDGWDVADAARLHRPSVTDEWAVPRFLLLRQMMGATKFRTLLRSFVDTHRGGEPVGWEEFAAAAEDAVPGFGARFVRSWLRNSTEPRVKTRWTFDAARERVLLRVDQVHELQAGAAAPAFPFLLPVRVTSLEGEVMDHLLEVDKRRDLLEVPASAAPAALEVDPDGALRELMSLESRGAEVAAPK